jgi:hypothetical protein
MFHMVVVLGFRDSVAFEDHILFWFLGQSQIWMIWFVAVGIN